MWRPLQIPAGLFLVASLVQLTAAAASDPHNRSTNDPYQQRGPTPGKPALPPEPGPFQRLVNSQKFVGPGILPAANPTGDGSFPLAAEFRLPGDFQPAEAILIVGGRLAGEYPELLARIVALAEKRISVVLLVSTPDERKTVAGVLTSAGISPRGVRFVEVPTDTIWVRDFGPIFVRRSDGSRVALDVEYEKDGRQQDNHAAATVAGFFGVPARYAPILLEGGSLLSNGQGLCVTTTVAVNRNISRGYDLATVREYFRRYFGFDQIVLLEPLHGETTGHVDGFACFTDSQTIVVGAYPQSVDPVNAAVLDRNAALLARVRTAKGKLRVVRVPMPSNEDDCWRTYTNGLFANGLLLLPHYPGVDAVAQQKAIETFQSLLPGWKVVGVDAGKLIAQEGAFRCITMHVPPDKDSPERGE